MKKILIWYLNELTNTGGPKGYLYNIHEYLKTNPNPQITFLVDLITPIKSKSKKCKQGKQSVFTYLLNDFKHIINYSWRRYNHKCPQTKNLDVTDYDIIHIHDIVEYYRFRKRYPNYPGKIILTNHSPCPWAYEEMAGFDNFVKLVRPFAIYKECQAYKKADYLLFPCKDAREPYEVNDAIKKVFTENENKFIYVPSSILDLNIDESRIQHYSEFGIPENAFVITYFGRHNYIKGYDILKQVGLALLDKYSNLYFLCAGKGEIAPLKHSRWIELGFINNPHELLYQSDLYISTNRETYFDLVVLEILRSSTKALLSDTGGNKFFKILESSSTSGIDFFNINDIDQLIAKVEECIMCKMHEPIKYKSQCQANRQLYLDYFTINKYVERYIDTINHL